MEACVGLDLVSNRPGFRTFALIVSAHRYCARKFTRHVMHEVISNILCTNILLNSQSGLAAGLPRSQVNGSIYPLRDQ